MESDIINKIEVWKIKDLASLDGEIWKDISGEEEKYQISNLGRVKSLSRRINTWNGYKTIPTLILSQSIRNGYLRVKINKSLNVHQLVSKAFVENPFNKNYINHKDGNKCNNNVLNLEWVTAQENIQHAWKTNLCNEGTREKMSKKAKMRTVEKNSCWRGYIDIYNIDKTFIIRVSTLKDAQEWIRANTNFKRADKGNISLVCNKKLKQMYGYIFEYNKIKEIL